MTRVVNIRKEPFDVYIGRPSKWGNPYTHQEYTTAKYKVATREEAIEKYREYVISSGLINDIGELAGKTLGCFCSPLPCHGDVLVVLYYQWANKHG